MKQREYIHLVKHFHNGSTYTNHLMMNEVHLVKTIAKLDSVDYLTISVEKADKDSFEFMFGKQY